MSKRQIIIFFVLFSAAGFLSWLIISDFPQKAAVSRQVKDLEAKIEALKKEEEKQKSLEAYLNSESYLEKQARLRLNFKKEGEEAVFVYRNDEPVKTPAGKSGNENPFLKKLKEWFSIFLPRD